MFQQLPTEADKGVPTLFGKFLDDTFGPLNLELPRVMRETGLCHPEPRRTAAGAEPEDQSELTLYSKKIKKRSNSALYQI